LRFDDKPPPPAEIEVETHIIRHGMARADINIDAFGPISQNAVEMYVLHQLRV
jgi:hypothetical protein